MEQPALFAELREFVMLHRPHGELRAIAGAPTPSGYHWKWPVPAVSCSSDGCSLRFETDALRTRTSYGSIWSVLQAKDCRRSKMPNRRGDG